MFGQSLKYFLDSADKKFQIIMSDFDLDDDKDDPEKAVVDPEDEDGEPDVTNFDDPDVI